MRYLFIWLVLYWIFVGIFFLLLGWNAEMFFVFYVIWPLLCARDVQREMQREEKMQEAFIADISRV